MPTPKNGTIVKITPVHAAVPIGESAGATFLPMAGRDVSWSRWWSQRLTDGDITINPPAPIPPVPAPIAQGSK